MKSFTTILALILTGILGRWIFELEGGLYRVISACYLLYIICMLGFGIYKTLEELEK